MKKLALTFLLLPLASCAGLTNYLRAGAITASTMADAIDCATVATEQRIRADLEPKIKAADELPEAPSTETIVGAIAAVLASIYGTNKVRDSKRKKRGEQV